MTIELWEDVYVLGLIFMALAILSKTTGTLAWEIVPNAHFPSLRILPWAEGAQPSVASQRFCPSISKNLFHWKLMTAVLKPLPF